MAASWGQYIFPALILFQSLLCCFLYLSHVSLLAKFDHIQPDLELRSRRDISVAEYHRNNLVSNNDSSEIVVTESSRKKHRKSHRLPSEYLIGAESTIAPPARTRLRTKSLRNKPPRRTAEDRAAALRESEIAYSGEMQHLPPVAVHFVADTTNYTKERHSHYAGNGRIKISGVYSDWRPASWTHSLGTVQHFRMTKGKVSISQEGLYLLYAQIHYANVQEVNCYRAIHNEAVLAQCCSTTAHPDRHEVKANTCTLLTTVYLLPQDKLWLTDVHERYVILTPEKSYFGLVQLYSPPQD